MTAEAVSSGSSVILGAVLVLAPIILVACIGIGVFGFSPEKAQNIRAAEAKMPIAMEEVRRIHIRSPDRFRHDRLDRHPFYICLHVAVFCYAICIFAGAPITSNLATLNQQTKMTMASCFIIGAALVLSGSAMGIKIGRWTVLTSIRDNITSPMLADDIRLPYLFGCAGAFAIGTSMAIYATTSFRSTLGSLGGWMTALAAIGCTWLFGQYFFRIRRYDRARTALIDRAVAQIVGPADEVD